MNLPRISPSIAASLSVVFAVTALTLDRRPLAAAADSAATTGGIEQKLLQRLERSPQDAAAWRMLGRLRLEAGENAGALDALGHAVSLDPRSVAAQFDLGRALAAAGNHDAAAAHFELAITLAPDSDYARQAAELMSEEPSAETGAIQQAGYEIRRFDGTERIEERLPLLTTTQRKYFTDYQLRFDAGGQYNSNVALTPLSRDLSPGNRDAFQLLFAPDLQVSVYEGNRWRTGAMYGGDYTLNTGGFDNFNLQSYRPGLFVESDLAVSDTLVVGRMDYEFGLDEFDGATFATRHRLTTSAVAVWPGRDATIGYWSIDDTDFRNDGAVPWITSRDGWTNAVGVSHEVSVGNRWLDAYRGGVQLEHAETRGSEYRYNGLELSGGVVIPLAWNMKAEVRGGWGLRDYPDFTSGPARNEHIFTAGCELRKPLGKATTLAAVVAYDRFVSDNVRFDSARFLSGLMLVFER